MAIKKEADGTYTVTYSKRNPITRQPVSLKRIKVGTAAEAKRTEMELVVKVNERINRKNVPTWSEFLEKYIQHIQVTGLKNMTVYNRNVTLRHHTLPEWDKKLITEITTQEIYHLLNERLGQNAESHKKFFIKCIKGAFEYAVETGALNRNPTPLLKFKISEKIKSVLNGDQIVHLLQKSQQMDWDWYPHYAVALYTGMRNGELYALTWDKVNLDDRQIKVDCSWTSKDGFKSTKSGDDRIVEIPNPLLPLLRELKMKAIGTSDFVLPRLSKWDKGDQARELRFFLKSVGLPEIRFHDLRASWATLLLSKGVAPSKVMSMGGWKDMDTMMIYMRKAGIDIKNSTSVLDNMVTHGVEEAQVVEMRPR